MDIVISNWKIDIVNNKINLLVFMGLRLVFSGIKWMKKEGSVL